MNLMIKCVSLGIASIMMGCTSTYLRDLDAQSHFDYPNSNVYPLGHVKGESSKTSFFTYPMLDGSLQSDAIDNAMAQKPEADLLINAIHFQDVTRLLIFPIYTVTYRVEGVAAKMEIGSQRIN